jgi:hypothetical protein
MSKPPKPPKNWQSALQPGPGHPAYQPPRPQPDGPRDTSKLKPPKNWQSAVRPGPGHPAYQPPKPPTDDKA